MEVEGATGRWRRWGKKSKYAEDIVGDKLVAMGKWEGWGSPIKVSTGVDSVRLL